MGLDIKAPENVILKPIITVFGVGGAGGNAVNNMIKANLSGAHFVVANTDAQALKHSESASKIQLGASSTKGLGAGASPDVGKTAAIESESEIRSYLEGSNMVFITAGMGGGTGTGASPEIAKIAKELGILTVGVVTKPFLFEGGKRMKIAEQGVAELQKHVDTLIVIPNQNLFRIANENTTFKQAFELADEVLHAGVRGIADLINFPGLVNLDFADIVTAMSEKGKAMMGTGEASGEDRAIKAAESAIANPLLDQSSMCGACGVLINITGGADMTLYEVDSAANRIREEIGESDANIIFGSTFNPELEGVIRVSVVATGIEQASIRAKEQAAQDAVQETNNSYMENANGYGEDVNVENNQIDVNDHEPPRFNEYDEGHSENTEEMQSRLDKIEHEMEWRQAQQNTNGQMGSKVSAAKKPKRQSFLKRMWNSLKSSEVEQDFQADGERNSDMNGGDSRNARRYSDAPSSVHDKNHNVQQNIQEKPSFVKRD